MLYEVIILYIAISPRSLAGAGFTISQLIKQDNIVEARQKLSWIVGRDTEDLDESENYSCYSRKRLLKILWMVLLHLYSSLS